MNLDKLFHLKENHTDVKTEVMAGITTFMTMAYILAVTQTFWKHPAWTEELFLQRPHCHPLLPPA